MRNLEPKYWKPSSRFKVEFGDRELYFETVTGMVVVEPSGDLEVVTFSSPSGYTEDLLRWVTSRGKLRVSLCTDQDLSSDDALVSWSLVGIKSVSASKDAISISCKVKLLDFKGAKSE